MSDLDKDMFKGDIQDQPELLRRLNELLEQLDRLLDSKQDVS